MKKNILHTIKRRKATWILISGFRRDVDEIALFWDITRRRVVIVSLDWTHLA
jgi:hypothetical protein